jgi:hypothetical protein
MKTATLAQAIIADVVGSDDNIRWFSADGCVVQDGELRRVFAGGLLIGVFQRRAVGVRNLLLFGLARNSKIRKDKLALAFGLGPERLRVICRKAEEEGLEAIPQRPQGGRKPLATPPVRRRMEALFSAGLSAAEAYERYGRRAGLTVRACRSLRQSWGVGHSQQIAPRKQLDLELPEAEMPLSATVEQEEDGGHTAEASIIAEDDSYLRSQASVQNLGSWLLVALVHALGLHKTVLSRSKSAQRRRERLRVTLDAVIIALALRQHCVEGVRRLDSASGPALLRCKSVPSANWTRRVLYRYVAEASATWTHLDMMQLYLERARTEEDAAAVFYVDNHLRPYTGKRTIRKGWRMQDKQVKPGVTDYYVHDEDGRPVWRFDVPSHDSLTSWLKPVTAVLRAALGDKQRILLAFDRAGAYPEQMAELRDSGIEFVTYERKPYALLPASAFTEEVTIDSETIGVSEQHDKNLKHGRGRVRRLALRMPSGQQVNLLAASHEPAWRLIEVMRGRWVQENAFKHGNERWGINHLDSRRVETYPPEAVIPNPVRRRLDHALRLARRREGDTLRQLARLAADDPKRKKHERDLAAAREDQAELEALRPQVPKHAPLAQTELRDKLVRHPGELKTLMDTVRIACANAESELAASLALHLRKPAEAKKVLANLFAAPGAVRVNGKTISVTLSPTGTNGEKRAIAVLLETVNRANLTLPGDPEGRQLRFRSQLS